MNVDSTNVPKNMLRQLWHSQSDGNVTLLEIKSWRMNAADGPTDEDLEKSVKLPGWKVQELDWPLSWRTK